MTTLPYILLDTVTTQKFDGTGVLKFNQQGCENIGRTLALDGVNQNKQRITLTKSANDVNENKFKKIDEYNKLLYQSGNYNIEEIKNCVEGFEIKLDKDYCSQITKSNDIRYFGRTDFVVREGNTGLSRLKHIMDSTDKAVVSYDDIKTKYLKELNIKNKHLLTILLNHNPKQPLPTELNYKSKKRDATSNAKKNKKSKKRKLNHMKL